eukprot:TRINITY_DN5537_c0_g2_i1.p1 TRINITY_DN5537_c0_g2~~TRINITY_DN5537_c0_g2_i1.p1  ORF type:complete len:391 (-),score=120.36 TRINITY_DN5537_c0_g2_i1:74-1246(-)
MDATEDAIEGFGMACSFFMEIFASCKENDVLNSLYSSIEVISKKIKQEKEKYAKRSDVMQLIKSLEEATLKLCDVLKKIKDDKQKSKPGKLLNFGKFIYKKVELSSAFKDFNNKLKMFNDSIDLVEDVRVLEGLGNYKPAQDFWIQFFTANQDTVSFSSFYAALKHKFTDFNFNRPFEEYKSFKDFITNSEIVTVNRLAELLEVYTSIEIILASIFRLIDNYGFIGRLDDADSFQMLSIYPDKFIIRLSKSIENCFVIQNANFRERILYDKGNYYYENEQIPYPTIFEAIDAKRNTYKIPLMRLSPYSIISFKTNEPLDSNICVDDLTKQLIDQTKPIVEQKITLAIQQLQPQINEVTNKLIIQFVQVTEEAISQTVPQLVDKFYEVYKT